LEYFVCETIEEDLAFGLECNLNDQLLLSRKFKKLKKNLNFISNWNLHPTKLSCGEMQIMNLFSAFSISPNLLVINNGLLYVSNINKAKYFKIAKKFSEVDTIVVWLTSEYSDLDFGDTVWELSSNDLCHPNLKNPIYKKNNITKNSLSLKIKNLKFKYLNSQKIVFNDLSFYGKEMSCLGITGQNGAGKSTLVKLISEIESPINGQILLKINSKKPSLGTLDQIPENLYNGLSFFEIIEKLKYHGRIEKDKIEKINYDLSSLAIDIEIYKYLPIEEISPYVVKAVLTIILFNCNFNLLILDEPTYIFGTSQKIIYSDILSKIKQKKHLIIFSHDFEFLKYNCDNILNIDESETIN
jgi:energy-coupling factor transporter ATP-binding protein EcfA2